MLARSGFYKSGDVEVEKNIIIRCERLGKVFITDEVSLWARRFLLYICTSVLLSTIVLKLFCLFMGLFLTFMLHFVWSRGGGASEMVGIGLERWASNTPAGLLDAWLLPDVRPASAFLALKPETHLQSRNPLPALTFDFRMSYCPDSSSFWRRLATVSVRCSFAQLSGWRAVCVIPTV